jgi:low temperature requirement protein LtrA
VGVEIREESAAGHAPWFSPPRLRTRLGEEERRRATWLELFFDLVFVVAITELAGALVENHSVTGFLRFAALFLPVYIAWQGYTFYADRFDSDDLGFRVALFAAMVAIAAMAVQIRDVAHGIHSAGFAVSYVILRSIMLVLYWRAWRAVLEARPLIRLYGLGYAVAVAIWVVSLAFSPPARYVVWGIAIALELSLPPLGTRIHRRVPTSASHVPERWALFTMIVMGESVVAIAVATASSHWHAVSAIAAVVGFASVAAAWWLYFDRQADVVLSGTRRSVVIYSYAHLPLLMGLAATGAGVRLLIERADDDHLGTGASCALLGGILVYLVALVATRSVTVSGPIRLGAALKLGTAGIILAFLLAEAVLPPLVLASALAATLLALVFLLHTFVPDDE